MDALKASVKHAGRAESQKADKKPARRMAGSSKTRAPKKATSAGKIEGLSGKLSDIAWID